MLVTGIDIIEIHRIRDVIARWGDRFLRRIYTPEELAFCNGKDNRLAARFAAKEAASKALGLGIRGIAWKRDRSGATTWPSAFPETSRTGRKASRISRNRPSDHIHLPLTGLRRGLRGRLARACFLKIVTPTEMARLERDAGAFGLSTDDLMEQAGLAIAQEIRKVLGVIAGRRILMLVGPGNNGGDGLVAARHLARWGASALLHLVAIRPDDDPNLRLALLEGAQLLTANCDDGLSALERALRSTHVAVDAVLGTGRSRPLSGTLANIMARVSKNARLPRNRRPLYVAVDVPTGVDAATGRADPLTPRIDLTLALGFPKVGHFIFPAANYVGILNTLDIGIPPELSKDISLELISPSWVRQQLPQRGLSGHKGTYGHALIVGGSVNYPGAACLAAGAALRSGVGLVTLAVPKGIYDIAASKLTEAIQLPLSDNGSGCLDPQALPVIRQASSSYSSMAVGCGMGRSEPAKKFLQGLMLSEYAPSQPLLLDADALNILAESCPDWWRRIPAPSVLTPTPAKWPGSPAFLQRRFNPVAWKQPASTPASGGTWWS